MKDNTCSIIIGRFNPLTTFHKSIISTMTGQRFVVTTSSHDEHRNPIQPSTKLRMLEATFQTELSPVRVMLCKDAIDALFVVGEAIKDAEIILHCGSDRGDDYQRLNRYTDQAGVTIKEVIVHDRLSEEHSATYLRQSAIRGDRDTFDRLCALTPEHREQVYNLIRRYASV